MDEMTVAAFRLLNRIDLSCLESFFESQHVYSLEDMRHLTEGDLLAWGDNESMPLERIHVRKLLHSLKPPAIVSYAPVPVSAPMPTPVPTRPVHPMMAFLSGATSLRKTLTATPAAANRTAKQIEADQLLHAIQSIKLKKVVRPEKVYVQKLTPLQLELFAKLEKRNTKRKRV